MSKTIKIPKDFECSKYGETCEGCCIKDISLNCAIFANMNKGSTILVLDEGEKEQQDLIEFQKGYVKAQQAMLDEVIKVMESWTAWNPDEPHKSSLYTERVIHELKQKYGGKND